MTLGELLVDLDRYANRTDPDYVDNRLRFIQGGHRWVERKFHGREALWARWQTSETVGTAVGVVPLPACYRASAQLLVARLPDRAPLTRIRPRDLRHPFTLNGGDYDFRDTTTLELPQFFAVIGRSLELRPLPATPLDLEISGTGWADPLTDLDGETVLTQEAPDAVLYAALRELWLFMGDEPQMQYWQTQAIVAVGEWVGDRIHEEEAPPLVMDIPG